MSPINDDMKVSVPIEGVDVEIAGSACLPLQGAPVAVAVALPGGGYSRHYYDPGLDGYSQARYFAERGYAFISLDHAGSGDSPEPAVPLSWAALAEVSHLAVLAVLERRALTALPRLGLGHSYGGLLGTIQQADHRTFDALALLGWSGLHTVLPTKNGEDAIDYTYAFHLEDVPQELVERDMRGFPARQPPVPRWGSVTPPGGLISNGANPDARAPGVVSGWARRVDVPLLILNGERDVCATPALEATAYEGCSDVTIVSIAGSAHIHNFSSVRETFWRRTEAWARSVLL